MLVDEFQHTNLPQYVLVHQLAEEHNDVFVVGDPDQAIYGWRGAELTNIMSFQRDFPAARRIDLQLAYRSSARLLEAATAMIRHNANRLDHRLRSVNLPGLPPAVHDAADPTAEASFAVSRAAARIVRDNGSVAILYRTNAQSRAFETALPPGTPPGFAAQTVGGRSVTIPCAGTPPRVRGRQEHAGGDTPACRSIPLRLGCSRRAASPSCRSISLL